MSDGPSIRSLQRATSAKGICVMVFGVPGAGKTRFIGTGPKTLIIRPPVDHTDSIELPAEVDEVVVTSWNEMLEVYQHLQQGGHKDYEWVWLDSISLLQDTTLDDIWRDTLARRPDRAAFGLDQGEYGRNMERLQRWTRDMHGLTDLGQINFGLTAHPFEWYDPVKEEDVWAPYIQGKNMSPKICGYMHIVAYLAEVRRKDKPSRRVLMTSADGFVGKDQIGIPEKIADPTMPKLISEIGKTRRPPRRRPTTKRPARRRR